jgi:hypothetical protein
MNFIPSGNRAVSMLRPQSIKQSPCTRIGAFLYKGITKKEYFPLEFMACPVLVHSPQQHIHRKDTIDAYPQLAYITHKRSNLMFPAPRPIRRPLFPILTAKCALQIVKTGFIQHSRKDTSL